MKKFWTVLALAALALNLSSAPLWANDLTAEAAIPAVVEEGVDSAEATLENAAMKDDEASTQPVEEKKAEVVAAPSNTVTAAVATTEEEKVEAVEPIVNDTTQTEAKVS